MDLLLLLFLSFLPSLTAEVVYARTDRLDKAEYDQWNKTCGMQSSGKKVPFKVMVNVLKMNGETKKCVGMIINKRFVLTTATCYYNRKLNSYENDSDMRFATNPINTKIVVCADDGINCDQGKGLKEVGTTKIVYPQMIHYSQDYETAANIALLQLGEDISDDRQICTPSMNEFFKDQKMFLVSDEITDSIFYEGTFEYKGARTCGDATVCAEKYSFKPAATMKKLSSGLFLTQKNDRMYLLGTLKYEGEDPKIMLIFPLFYDFVCSNTGNCGAVYDEYMFMRETRAMVNGLPLPQVSHCDINFSDCDNDPLFFRFIPEKEMEYLEKNCGKELTPPSGVEKNKWNEYPYMAAIVGKSRICSGAFISQVHVITVAHCLFINEGDNDEFFKLRDKEPGTYMDPTNFEVRYGSECYADGLTNPDLDKCNNAEHAKLIKTSKVRNIIIDGLRTGSTEWRYKYQLVLLELEQPVSKEVVIPICPFPGILGRTTSFKGSSEDSFDFTSAGNPESENSFVFASGNRIQGTDCAEFRHEDRIQDYNCRDDNVDVVTLGESDAQGFTKTSIPFLGSQLSLYNSTAKRRFLYGLAHYFTPNAKDNILGAFYPIWKNERYICWFTGVCYQSRPHSKENRHFKIYTPEYRLTRSPLNAPVQRAGKNNLSNYESVMWEEMDTQW